MFRLILYVCLCLGARSVAATIGQSAVGAAVNEAACTVNRTASRFDATEDQVYFRFVARQVAPSDRLRVEWIDPDGAVASAAAYETLPAAASLCFVNALPLAGFPAAQQPGTWTVRVTVNGAVAASRAFEIAGKTVTGGPVLTEVLHQETGGGSELTVAGRGFVSETVVNVAQYTPAGGWNYIAALIPEGVSGGRATVRLPPLEPAEYLVIARNPDGGLSPPARFLISTPGRYKLPTPEGVPWIITQGPYGGFSHYGRSRHAWDIAPRSGGCVVSMRGGVAHTFDKGWRQTPGRRIFGNYITIAHEDGEYSHYGHLQSGTFRVKDGERVAQGQPLATAGNSGYAVGQGGGVHVHVHVTKAFSISSQSIPFRFDDLPASAARVRPAVVTSANRVSGDCEQSPEAETYTGAVAVTEVWSKPMQVARGATAIDVNLDWDSGEHGLDLSLVSPTGREHALHADARGFDDAGRRFRLALPEPGQWLLCVRGVRGTGERVGFRLHASVIVSASAQSARGR